MMLQNRLCGQCAAVLLNRKCLIKGKTQNSGNAFCGVPTDRLTLDSVIITDRIEQKQAEFEELAARAENIQQQLAEEKKQEYASDLLSEYEDQIRELQNQKENLDAEISGLKDELDVLKSGSDLKQRLNELEEQVDYKEKRERELDTKLKAIDDKLDSIFANSTEKALKFSFDGMLSNRMLQQAAEWENQQNAINYANKIDALKGLTISTVNQAPLIDKLVAEVQKYRPNLR